MFKPFKSFCNIISEERMHIIKKYEVATHQYSGFTSHLTALKRSFSNNNFSAISKKFFCNMILYFLKRADNENCSFHGVCKQRDHQKQMLLAAYLRKD